MKSLNYILAALSLLGLCVVSWWGVYHSPQSAAHLEKELTEVAQKALDDNQMNWATVSFTGQVANITGIAPTLDTSKQAAEIVLTSAGPGGPILGGVSRVTTDGVTEAPPVSSYSWRASKNSEGDWILSGYVPSGAIRSSLVASAEKATDGRVEDRMEFAAGVPAGNWRGVANEGIQQLAKLESGEVALVDFNLSLLGTSPNSVVRSRIEQDIASLAAPYRGSAIVEGEARWSAYYQGGALILSGTVASTAERMEVVDIATATATVPVDDQMKVAEFPVDNWMEGVKAILPQFARFETGRFSYDAMRKGLNISGTATSSTLAYLREDLEGLSDEFDVTNMALPIIIGVGEIDGIDFDAEPVEACERGFEAVLETGKVYFTTGSAEISRESGATLDKLLAVSSKCSVNLIFEVGGHTDNVGERALNVALSEARARAVADYLSAAGVAQDRLKVVGYGPDEPVADNAIAEGRAKNRRIQFKITERSE